MGPPANTNEEPGQTKMQPAEEAQSEHEAGAVQGPQSSERSLTRGDPLGSGASS